MAGNPETGQAGRQVCRRAGRQGRCVQPGAGRGVQGPVGQAGKAGKAKRGICRQRAGRQGRQGRWQVKAGKGVGVASRQAGSAGGVCAGAGKAGRQGQVAGG